jgi:hypothetical protein
MTEEQINRAKYCSQELRYHAQNNEMIDQYYTELGNLCNEIADFLDDLVNNAVPDVEVAQ